MCEILHSMWNMPFGDTCIFKIKVIPIKHNTWSLYSAYNLMSLSAAMQKLFIIKMFE